MKTRVKVLLKDLFTNVEAFFLAPASPRPLGALRIGMALILLVEIYLVRNDILNYFAHDGLIQGPLAQYLAEPGTPQLSWLVDYLGRHGIIESSVIIWVT